MAVLLGLVGALTAGGLSRRLRTEQRIAAALRAAPLGVVAVAGDRPARGRRGRGRCGTAGRRAAR
ncbi:hypothetical protein VM98_34645 [Streptomyces rubellomurinus subsp. indigoferus]|nr:hypothetical protein VM98_34645 [Streptomyces rubellomurinus subsp. indigoferus]